LRFDVFSIQKRSIIHDLNYKDSRRKSQRKKRKTFLLQVAQS